MDSPGKRIKLPFSKRSTSLKDFLLHSIYWILITGFFIYEKRYLIQKASMPYFVACVSVRILLLIVIAYLNLHFFLPAYLLKKRYWSYFGAVLLSVIGYLIVQGLFDYYLYGYVIGPVRNSDLMEALSYNFFSTLWYLGLMLALKLSIDWYGQVKVLNEIKIEKLQGEVNYLRSQINPHFLFNALNNLYGLTLKKSDAAPEVVLKLSEMMEYMLYESNEAVVPLEKEIRYLHNYLELEKLRQGNHAEISLVVTGNIDHCSIPPFLLLPLVENAFKHGISQAIHNAYLRITIHVEQGIEVMIINNKSNSLRNDRSGGVGLTNLTKRLGLLYPEAFEFKVINKPEQYCVSLKINCRC